MHSWQVEMLKNIYSIYLIFVDCLISFLDWLSSKSMLLESNLRLSSLAFDVTVYLFERLEKSKSLLTYFKIRSYPKSSPPTTIFLNSILLQVRVPVLSVRIYWTWPSSSLMLTVWHSVFLSFNPQYNYLSLSIKIPWKTFTNYKDTIKDMGMKVL